MTVDGWRRRVVGAVILWISAGGCSNPGFSSGDREISFNPDVAAPVAATSGWPMFACLGSITENTRLIELTAMLPEGARTPVRDQDRGWQPVEPVDISGHNDRVAIVDRRVPGVVVTDSNLQRVWARETRGMGPGEFHGPTKVRFQPATGELWILDPSRRLLLSFDASGQPSGDVEVPGSATNFDVTDDGQLIVAHQVIRSSVRDSAVLLTAHAKGSGVLAVLNVRREELTPPAFVLPGPNRPQLRLLDGLVAVFYAVSGVVDLYEYNGTTFRLHRRIESCIAPELEQAYRAQLESREKRQTFTEIISDVARIGDTLFVLGARQDAEGRYGIQRFSLGTGDNLGTISAPAGGRTLPSILRFIDGNPRSILVVDGFRGLVAKLRFEPTQP